MVNTFGITARDINGVEYGFVVYSWEAVREFAQDCYHTYGTMVTAVTMDNEYLGAHDVATLCYGTLPWEYTGFDRVALI
jgi:hypothetical protein